MSQRPRRFIVLLFCPVLLLQRHADAQPQNRPGDPQQIQVPVQDQAAMEFDRGVKAFSDAQFEIAAQHFLAADTLSPRLESLQNALIAARRAESPLVIADAATQILGRTNATSILTRRAREALVEANPKISTLRFQCPRPSCNVFVDGERVRGSTAFVWPGAHLVFFESGGGRSPARQVDCTAGTICTVVLLSSEKSLSAEASSPSPSTAAPVSSPSAPAAMPSGASVRPFSPWVFAVAAGTTVLLGGVTVWSGMDALAERHRAETDPSGYDPDAVRRKALRTDLLFVAGCAMAAGTIWIGTSLVQWHGVRVTGSAAVGAGGAELRVGANF